MRVKIRKLAHKSLYYVHKLQLYQQSALIGNT